MSEITESFESVEETQQTMNKRIAWNEGEHGRYEYNTDPSIFEDLYYRLSVKLESNPLSN